RRIGRALDGHRLANVEIDTGIRGRHRSGTIAVKIRSRGRKDDKASGNLDHVAVIGVFEHVTKSPDRTVVAHVRHGDSLCLKYFGGKNKSCKKRKPGKRH